MFNKIRGIEQYLTKESEKKELKEISDIAKDNISIKLDKQSLLNLLDPGSGKYQEAEELVKNKYIDQIP